MAVAVSGLNFGLVRGACDADEREPCTSHLTLPALIFVPPMGLLFVTAVNVGLGIGRRGSASPFATGYLLLGGLASLGVCLDFAIGTNLLGGPLAYIEGVLDPSVAPGVAEIRLTSSSRSVFDGWVGDILLVLVYGLTQIASAMVGAGACRALSRCRPGHSSSATSGCAYWRICCALAQELPLNRHKEPRNVGMQESTRGEMVRSNPHRILRFLRLLLVKNYVRTMRRRFALVQIPFEQKQTKVTKSVLLSGVPQVTANERQFAQQNWLEA